MDVQLKELDELFSILASQKDYNDMVMLSDMEAKKHGYFLEKLEKENLLKFQYQTSHGHKHYKFLPSGLKAIELGSYSSFVKYKESRINSINNVTNNFTFHKDVNQSQIVGVNLQSLLDNRPINNPEKPDAATQIKSVLKSTSKFIREHPKYSTAIAIIVTMLSIWFFLH